MNDSEKQPLQPPQPPDQAVLEVAQELRRLDPSGDRWAEVIRHAYDTIYNGRETGRYRWDQLAKTEKTHFGTLIEIYAARKFGFDDGESTDFRIAGHQVDAKWSQSDGGWMLPPEVFDEIALVVTGSDEKACWSLGLIRVTAAVRREKTNRDAKSQLSKLGRESIYWIWRDAPLSPNVLLQLSGPTVIEVFGETSGTRRLAQLMRSAEAMIVSRSTVETVAQQKDSQKRMRSNGGVRSVLADDGYLVLSGAYDSQRARDLGISVPNPDEYISVRVVPTDDPDGATLIDGRYWRKALPGEESGGPAPKLH